MFIPIQRIISTLNINCSFFITPKCQNIRWYCASTCLGSY
jgi:hypothetical protein